MWGLKGIEGKGSCASFFFFFSVSWSVSDTSHFVQVYEFCVDLWKLLVWWQRAGYREEQLLVSLETFFFFFFTELLSDFWCKHFGQPVDIFLHYPQRKHLFTSWVECIALSLCTSGTVCLSSALVFLFNLPSQRQLHPLPGFASPRCLCLWLEL